MNLQRLDGMKKISITAGGDALMVKHFPKGYTGRDAVRDYILKGDFSVVNAETNFSDFDCFPSSYSGGTWVNARPEILPEIMSFGFSGCGASNNHSMDYSYGGLFSSIATYEKYKVPYCGIGKSLETAAEPMVLENEKGRVAVISICAEFNDAARAGETAPDLPPRPGLNPLRHSTVFQVTPEHMNVLKKIAKNTAMNGTREADTKAGFFADDGTFFFGGVRFIEGDDEKKITRPDKRDVARTCNKIREIADEYDAVLVMFHSHDIKGFSHEEPDYYAEEFCRECIDAGATAIIGGGTHELKPVEIYKGKPIFHSLGDFVFQNNCVEILPPDFKEKYGVPITASAEEALDARSNGGKRGLHTDIMNYLSAIPYFEVEDKKVTKVKLRPIELGFYMDEEIKGLPHIADRETSERIFNHLKDMSEAYGTKFSFDGEEIEVLL